MKELSWKTCVLAWSVAVALVALAYVMGHSDGISYVSSKVAPKPTNVAPKPIPAVPGRMEVTRLEDDAEAQLFLAGWLVMDDAATGARVSIYAGLGGVRFYDRTPNFPAVRYEDLARAILTGNGELVRGNRILIVKDSVTGGRVLVVISSGSVATHPLPPLPPSPR